MPKRNTWGLGLSRPRSPLNATNRSSLRITLDCTLCLVIGEALISFGINFTEFCILANNFPLLSPSERESHSVRGRWHVCVLNLLSFWNSMICSQNLTRSVLSILHESDYEYFTKGKIFVIVMKIFWIKVIIHLSFNKVKSFLSSWLNLLVFCSKRVQYGRTAEEWVIKCIEGI